MSRIEDDIKDLVFHLTGCRNNERSHDYCCVFMREAMCDDSPTPKTSISDKLENFVTKLDYLGFPQYSQQLSNAVKSLTDGDVEAKVNWSIFDLLLRLSNEVFKPEVLCSLGRNLATCRTVSLPEDIPEEVKIDWFKYLQEGSEKFKLPDYDEEDSEDEYPVFSSKDEHDTETIVVEPLTAYNNIFADFAQPEMVVHDENTQLKNTLKEAVDAKSWLTESVQHFWWNGEESTVSQSVYPSANFGCEWETKQNELMLTSHRTPSNFRYHNEYKIIRELLLILTAYDKSVSCRVHDLRSRTSIPSLIQETFASVVDDFLKTAEMYAALTSFCDEILRKYVLQVSFTLKAFTFAVKDFCKAFRQTIIDTESIVKKQDDEYTLLTLYDDLRGHLQVIKFLFQIRKECIVTNWMDEAPWICSIRIMSVLLSKYQEMSSKRMRQIVLKIFFKTFKVSAEIIDVWFAEGKLNDWKNEFFIQKSESGKFVAFPFNDKEVRSAIVASSVFHRLSIKLLSCSESIDFLRKLNKTEELKMEMRKEGKLIDRFLEQLTKRTRSTIHYSGGTSGKNHSHVNVVVDCEPCYDFNSRVSEIPYLLRAFSDQLGPVTSAVKIVPRNRWSSTWEKELENFDSALAGPMLEQLLCDLIRRREAIVIRLFRAAIVEDCRFLDHVRNLKQILLMDWSNFCDGLAIRLDEATWIEHNMIRFKLYDCVECSIVLPFPDLFRFTIDDAENMGNFEVNVSGIIKAVDRVSLQYEVEWPLNMIFSADVMKSFYSPLLKLVLKIKFAFSIVTRLRFKDVPQTKLYAQKLRRIQMFRHWVVLLLQKLQSYLLFAISQGLDCRTIENNLEIETFGSLLESYTAHLDKTKRSCLIDEEFSEHFGRALNRIWLVCDDIVCLWRKASKLQASDHDVSRSVELYLQCSWYLTKILQKFTEGVLCPLHVLWSDLNGMLEAHRSTIPEDLSFKFGSTQFCDFEKRK